MLGSQRLFDYINHNPSFEFQPISYTNNPFVVAKNDNMVAINSALQVDMTGQVCADSLGTKPFSGFGGQVDFIRGAARSKGGVPIIALPSTAKGGTVSRIVPMLEPGAGVVTSRADVHYRGDRARHRVPARQDAARAGRGADRHCRSAVQSRAGRFRGARALHGAQSSGGRAGLRNEPLERNAMENVEKKDRGKLQVDVDECKGCGLCVEACPPKVIEMGERLNHYGYRTAAYKGSGCTGCGICFVVCPEPGAITVSRLVKQERGAEAAAVGASACASN